MVEDIAGVDVDAPIELMPSEPVEPLSDAEMRELLVKVRDLHAGYVFIKENAPAVIDSMKGNPMLKMFGGNMFGGN